MKSILFLFSVLLFTSVSSEGIEFHIGGINGYRTLEIAPWSSMNEIKAQYALLKRKANSVEKDELEQALNAIIEERKDNGYDDSERMKILSLVASLLANTLLFEGVFGIFALIFFYLNKFQKFLASPLFFVVLAFELVSKLIPFYFESFTTQYLFSIFLAIILYFLKVSFFKLINKEKEKGN